MQADEFRATWVANKAIYRTRMAMADGGELLVIAPGVERFGEQPEVDALIRKYGYCGTSRALEQVPHERRHAGNRARDCPPHPRIIRRPIHDSLCPWPPLQSRNGRGPLRLRRLGAKPCSVTHSAKLSEGWKARCPTVKRFSLSAHLPPGCGRQENDWPREWFKDAG